MIRSELHEIPPVEGSVISGVAVMLGEKIERILSTAEDTPEVMNSKQCATFVADRSKGQFAKLAPKLPRHYIEGQGWIYVRSEIIEWILEH